MFLRTIVVLFLIFTGCASPVVKPDLAAESGFRFGTYKVQTGPCQTNELIFTETSVGPVITFGRELIFSYFNKGWIEEDPAVTDCKIKTLTQSYPGKITREHTEQCPTGRKLPSIEERHDSLEQRADGSLIYSWRITEGAQKRKPEIKLSQCVFVPEVAPTQP